MYSTTDEKTNSDSAPNKIPIIYLRRKYLNLTSPLISSFLPIFEYLPQKSSSEKRIKKPIEYIGKSLSITTHALNIPDRKNLFLLIK